MISNSSITLILIFLITISCGNDESSERFVVHPIEENIPFADRPNTEIDLGTDYRTTKQLPRSVERLHNYLEDPEEFYLQPLNIVVGIAEQVDIVAVDHRRIIIIDKSSVRLLEYDLETGEGEELAKRGRGPGDIAYPQEMIKNGKDIYIAMEDMRVSRFDCSSPNCNYVETINTDFSVLSMAIQNDGFVVIGQTINRGEEDYEVDEHAAHLLDRDGKILDSFGYFYETKEFILRFSMRGEIIRYSPSEEQYILSSIRLPYIYIFDNNLDFLEKYKIKEFVQGQIVHNPGINAAKPQFTNLSFIQNVQIIENQYALITISTHSEDGFLEKKQSYGYRQDYYLLDLASGENYFVGKDYSNNLRLLDITDYGLFLKDNGKISRVSV